MALTVSEARPDENFPWHQLKDGHLFNEDLNDHQEHSSPAWVLRLALTGFLGVVGFMKGAGLLWHPLVIPVICLSPHLYPSNSSINATDL